jgi:hypothetical protein
MAGVSGMMRHTPNQFSQTEQTSRLQREGAAAGVALEQAVARADFDASSGGSVAG